jgi:peptidoglycan hydrolase-like protein with peptidoglycan-binding domain
LPAINFYSMEEVTHLEAALAQGDISKSLFRGSASKSLITDLQRVLFELGFKNELKFDTFQADGDYGQATQNAVQAFATKNKDNSNGSKVTNQLAKLILQRHDFLPSMHILWSISQSDLRTKKFISKGTKTSITAVQMLLNERGFGALLNFAKFGADGIYGGGTRKAAVAYAKANGIESDGDLLTRPMIDLMLRDINVFYGSSWSDLAVNNLPADKSPLVLFEASRFQGSPCRADVEFLPALNKINALAAQADVFIHVTSSFRTSTNVKGAIVKPATRSNHLAGHAIDMNVVYDNKTKLANSAMLGKFPAVPEPVRLFIKSVIDDPSLRWGGQFNAKDPVHIDDGLNGDMAKWDKRYKAMQKAVQLGS